MAHGLHKTVLYLTIATAIVLCETDKSRDSQNDRSRRSFLEQAGKLFLKGAKYPTIFWRVSRAKRLLLEDATLQDKKALLLKYSKYGGKERAERDFRLLGPYDDHQFYEKIAVEMDGTMVKEGHIGAYTVQQLYSKTDGAPKYCIQMFKTTRSKGMAPVIQVDYIGPNVVEVRKNYFE